MTKPTSSYKILELYLQNSEICFIKRLYVDTFRGNIYNLYRELRRIYLALIEHLNDHISGKVQMTFMVTPNH